MALTSEDLQAIASLMDQKLKPINEKLKTVDERLKTVDEKLEILEIKQDITARKLEDVNFRLTSLEYNTKKEFVKVNDEIETLIAVLEAKGILPKQA